MSKVKEFISTFPEEPNEREVKRWVNNVLKASKKIKRKETGVGVELRVELPAIEAAIYRELVRLYGEPEYVETPIKKKKQYKGPNPSLLFTWALQEKYDFGLRLYTQIDADNTMHYQV